LLVVGGTSVTGIFSGSLSDKDAAEVHKIRVISLFGDTLHLGTVGLTVFGNKNSGVPVPEWGVDAAVTEHVPLMGLWTHAKGGLYHGGIFATLLDVVDHYDLRLDLHLSAHEQSDLVQYLNSL
jgi:hypothetical protein